MKKCIFICVIVGLIAAGVSFYGGMKYGQGQRNGLAGLRREGQWPNAAGGRTAAGLVSGEIILEDGQSITVKLPDGGTRLILLSGSTEITKSTTGSIADLAVGTEVIVSGSQNSDASLTAKTIQLRNNLK